MSLTMSKHTTCVTQDITRSRASQKAASLEPHDCKDSDIRKAGGTDMCSKRDGTFLADDLVALGQSRLIPRTRNKALFVSLTSDSLEVCFLPLTLFWSFLQGSALVQMICVWINISFQLGFISQRIRSRDTQQTGFAP